MHRNLFTVDRRWVRFVIAAWAFTMPEIGFVSHLFSPWPPGIAGLKLGSFGNLAAASAA
jgi:hypothetical protein